LIMKAHWILWQSLCVCVCIIFLLWLQLLAISWAYVWFL